MKNDSDLIKRVVGVEGCSTGCRMPKWPPGNAKKRCMERAAFLPLKGERE